MSGHIWTDDPGWASAFMDPLEIGPFQSATPVWLENPWRERLLGTSMPWAAAGLPALSPPWPMILRREAPESQFDVLLALARAGVPLPPVVVAVAGSGFGFHGSAGRPWVALEGNLHVCVLFTLNRPRPLPLPLLTPWIVNEMADVVDALPGFPGRVGIKWVNDLLVDHHKVGGAIAATLSQGNDVGSLLVGMGLNVAKQPKVERAQDSPLLAALEDLAATMGAPAPQAGGILASFLVRLDKAFARLEADPVGEGEAILARYCSRSLILGEEVEVVDDQAGNTPPPGQLLARGRVRSIGSGLALDIEGHATPVTRGRVRWPLSAR